MIISRLLLHNFRNYTLADFSFSPGVTFIIGQNTAGKSNILEAINLLTCGKSFRTDKDSQMVKLNNDVARITAEISIDEVSEKSKLEIVLAEPNVTGSIFSKRFLINGLPKRRIDFSETFHALLFEPSDLDIVSGTPSLRREFLDEVLEQTDRDYRQALLSFTKALRQRNALLQRAKETGIRQEKQFDYWDQILIESGSKITSARAQLIEYLNAEKKELFNFILSYDKSEISVARLNQYKREEAAAGITLVGPHRDDVLINMQRKRDEALSLKYFGSRGQQRLTVLQLKLLQLSYLHQKLEDKPVLLLDDIFSELDEDHIKYILEVVNKQQTIITTTHKEFLDEAGIKNPRIIELKKE
jgi:DNA replication and repair protein RecF